MLLIVSGTDCVFVKVTFFALLALPNTTFPNDSVEGVRVTCA
jgi:hypothetical protein